MNFKKNSIITFGLALSLFVLSAVAFGQTEPVRSQFSLYGMHFISVGQTVRVSVQNPRFSNSEVIPCVRVRIVFDVYEAIGDGSVRLRFARRVSREVELEPGDAATFDFSAGRIGEYVSPMVFASPEEAEPSAPIRLLSTLVVREVGRTILNLPAVLKGFDPQPDPPSSQAQ
ncbi:MAG: hypothetical protein ABI481_07620 [Pyrinomonadaceae bacterium]